MSSNRSKDIALVAGLAIPVLMILFVAGAIYLPRLFSSVEPPQHDFLYMVGSPYSNERYAVVEGRLERHELEETDRTRLGGDWPQRLYIHRVATNTSEQVSLEVAEQLSLDGSPRSPDGFEIVHGRKSEFFFPILSSTDYRTRYLQQDGWSTKLHLELDSEQGYYASTFNFLGWIVEEPTWTR